MWKKTSQMYKNRESVDVEKACVGAVRTAQLICSGAKKNNQLRHQICKRHFLHCYKSPLTATSTSPETTKMERAMKERQSALSDSAHGPAGR